MLATGGLGGVHSGGESSMDISADLTELGRHKSAVVSSGCKGFLDIPRTLEYLETQKVCVATFADGRSGDVDFPAFWTRDSGSRSPSTINNEKEAAAIICEYTVLRLCSLALRRIEKCSSESESFQLRSKNYMSHAVLSSPIQFQPSIQSRKMRWTRSLLKHCRTHETLDRWAAKTPPSS